MEDKTDKVVAEVMREKIRLQPIMEIEELGVIAYVRMPNPGRTFPASGEDLKKRL